MCSPVSNLFLLTIPNLPLALRKNKLKVESWPCDLTVPDIPRNTSWTAAAVLGE